MNKPTAVELNNDQKKALEILMSDKNVFLTGGAGTGKSTLINYYKKHHNRTIQTLSSTALSALLIGGRTFHSFFGINLVNEPLDVVLDRVMSNPVMVARLLKTREVLIDEVSMLSSKAIDYASYVAKMVRGNAEPFGGIRVICVGDFYQLGPVTTDRAPIEWAFNSLTWEECNFSCIELKEFMRTKDEHFLKVLSAIRRNLVGPEVTKFLDSKIIRNEPNFIGTRIFSRKAMVQGYNEEKLKELPGEVRVFKTRYTGDSPAVVRLKRILPIDEDLMFKIGAFVMCRVNDPTKNKEYVNGTLGHIMSMSDSSLLIKTLDGKYIDLPKHTFELRDGNDTVISAAVNFGVQLAYALTIHKSQGSSVDRAIIDGKNLFSSGQFYTAISRMTNSEGLRITGWDRRSIFVDQEVVEFYKRIKHKTS